MKNKNKVAEIIKPFFSFKGRMGRKNFFLIFLAIVIVLTVVEFTTDKVFILFVFWSVLLFLHACNTVKRLHDINKPGWHYWLSFIPIYNIYFAVVMFTKEGVVIAHEDENQLNSSLAKLHEDKNKIKEIWFKYHPFFAKTKEIIKKNKIIILIILISILPIYFFGIKPTQIRKKCAMVEKWTSTTIRFNPGYNENTEKQKRKKLGEYLQCRKSHLAEGDDDIKQSKVYTFTQTQYETSPLEELERLILKGLSSDDFRTYLYGYNGYFIDLPTYMDLEKNKNKYPQCDFPQPYTEKEIMEGGYRYLDNASDKEYKTCLRKHGLGN